MRRAAPEGRRIAVFLPTLAGGGAERVMCQVAEALAELGMGVDLVVGNAEPRDVAPPVNVRLVDLAASRMLTAMPRLHAYIRRARPLAIVSALTHANVATIAVARAAGRRTRVVVTEHVHLSRFGAVSPYRVDSVLPRLVRHVYPLADTVVAVSAGVADDLAREARMARSRVRVIRNPIAAERIRELASGDAPHPWLADRAGPVLVSAGRLVAQKDYPALIRALALVRRQVGEARLIVIGEGAERARLESLVAELRLGDAVALPGFVRDPYRYLARADLVVLSSVVEGLPTVLLEALALGRPIVATDCPSGPREILEDGRLGRLVPPGDTEALAAAIVTALCSESAAAPGLSPGYEPERVARAYLAACLGRPLRAAEEAAA